MADQAGSMARQGSASDYTIVVGASGMGAKQRGGRGLQVADSANDIARVAKDAGCGSSSGSGSASSGPPSPTAAPGGAGGDGKDAAAAALAGAPPPAARPRTYYIDWLRVFLTLLVVVHHCVCAYQTSYAWNNVGIQRDGKRRDDPALWLLSQLFVTGNQAYFMTLFFFLSGLYVPGSYRRKGAPRFLLDRTLRLVLPCIIYSMVAAPLIIMFNDVTKNPKLSPSVALANAYKGWLKPGWPSTYVLPTGPPWFVWMLWCFNVAYVLLRLAADPLLRARAAKAAGLPSAAPTPARRGPRPQWSNGTTAAITAGVAAALFVSCYAVRMLDYFAFNIRPTAFVVKGPFVSFMPDYLPVYLIAFGLGLFSGPTGWDVLARLPDAWGPWGLCVGGVWWLLFGWLLNVTLGAFMALKLGLPAFVGTWAVRTFVEQTFCVVWSVGLLVVFRRAFNAKPNWLGGQLIGAAYGAYLVHMVVIMFPARAIMDVNKFFPSAVISAAIISPPVVLGSWLLAIGLRALPGAKHVL